MSTPARDGRITTGSLAPGEWKSSLAVRTLAAALSRPPLRLAMRAGLFAFAAILLSGPVFAQARIDSINTNFRWLGPDDKIIVERYDDPRVQNVSCYLSRAETGGIKGGLGFAQDPSRFSIACRAVGPVTMPESMPRSEVIAFSRASLFFKTFQIHRALDPEKHVLVYTVVSTKLINGSPFNSISVVPTDVR
jgi:CreA protein